MKELIERLQKRLVDAKFPTGVEPTRKNDRLFEYVDLDWGQVDFYQDLPPVKFPAALIDIDSVSYGNLGNGTQQAIVNIQVRIIELTLSAGGGRAPQELKKRADRVFDLVNEANKLLHLWTDGDTFGPLTRISLEKVNRRDGLKEYRLVYQARVYDESAKKERETVQASPVIKGRLY
ncbi:MAG: hypothetical protein LBG19_11285 [Prevotellaceae bacterium]|jgi:hypothetical protein|nr:hypothetical protein [Prevotellaceae bacterium]